MAITKNAKRGVRVSERKRVVNDKLRRTTEGSGESRSKGRCRKG
jgi:hypothetical protein